MSLHIKVPNIGKIIIIIMPTALETLALYHVSQFEAQFSRAELFNARSSQSQTSINFKCHLSMAKGGFVTKLWPSKVTDYKYFFLEPQSSENPPLMVNK